MMPCESIIAASLIGFTLASVDAVVIGTEAPFAPYTYVDDQGQISGFERDIVDEVCQRAALECTWITTQFDSLIPGVMSGRFDIIAGGIARTRERAELVDFTTVYSQFEGADHYIGRPGAPAPETARIGVQSGTIQESFLREKKRDFQSYPNEGALIQGLLQGDVQLAFGAFYADSLTDLMAANGLDWLYDETIGNAGTAMAVCKGNTDLLEKLDAALAAMLTDGSLDDISNRWF